jgi:hypothetical protein
MTEVSHTGPRKRRPWTAQEQTFSEVAIACGCTLKEIGAALSRPPETINRRVKCGAFEAHAEVCRKYREENRDKVRDTRRRYREAYPERVKDSQRRFHQANPEAHMGYYYANHEARKAKCREYNRINREKRRHYRQANRERRASQCRNWYAINKDKVREYNKKNAERIRAQRRDYYKRNAQILREKTLRYNYRKRASRRSSLISSIEKERRLRQHVFDLFSNRCAYCGTASRLELDHVMPLSKGGLDERGNLVPACKFCNTSKQARPVETWYRSQPFFTEARWRKIQRHCPAAVVGQLSIGA